MTRRHRRWPIHPELDVSIERGGETVRGTYVLERGMLTVRSDHGSKSADLGDLRPGLLARLVLSELVDDGRRNGRARPAGPVA